MYLCLAKVRNSKKTWPKLRPVLPALLMGFDLEAGASVLSKACPPRLDLLKSVLNVTEAMPDIRLQKLDKMLPPPHSVNAQPEWMNSLNILMQRNPTDLNVGLPLYGIQTRARQVLQKGLFGFSSPWWQPNKWSLRNSPREALPHILSSLRTLWRVSSRPEWILSRRGLIKSSRITRILAQGPPEKPCQLQGHRQLCGLGRPSESGRGSHFDIPDFTLYRVLARARGLRFWARAHGRGGALHRGLPALAEAGVALEGPAQVLFFVAHPSQAFPVRSTCQHRFHAGFLQKPDSRPLVSKTGTAHCKTIRRR